MKTKNCLKCQYFNIEKESTVGECRKNKWQIKIDLAKRQAVCDDSETDKIENVQILTPLGHKVLISKEAYEKEKNGENYWKPIHEGKR